MTQLRFKGTTSVASWLALILMGGSYAAFAADVCDFAHLQGPYGFQLSGETTISGSPKPVAGLGRLIFDGEGAISGSSSVMFAGFLLGNPTTGKSEVHGDCTISWSLQDDSGGYQHFGGAVTPDGKTVRFRQTDAGGAQNGVMAKTSDRCSATTLRKQYDFTLSGSSVPMSPGDVSTTVNAKGLIRLDDESNFKLVLQGTPAAAVDVAVKVEDDCILNLEFTLPAGVGAAASQVKLRGILVNDGKDILAIRTDPGWMAPARLTAH